MTEPQHAELLAAKRLLTGCSKALAFPEKLTPNVKAMLHDQYTVTQAFMNQCDRTERLEAALREIEKESAQISVVVLVQKALRQD